MEISELHSQIHDVSLALKVSQAAAKVECLSTLSLALMELGSEIGKPLRLLGGRRFPGVYDAKLTWLDEETAVILDRVVQVESTLQFRLELGEISADLMATDIPGLAQCCLTEAGEMLDRRTSSSSFSRLEETPRRIGILEGSVNEGATKSELQKLVPMVFEGVRDLIRLLRKVLQLNAHFFRTALCDVFL